CFFFFFFQAEDGIRDGHVTGVQTCALPIWSQAKALRMIDALGGLEDAVDGAATLAGLPKPPKVVGPRRRFSVVDLLRNQLGLTGLATPSLPLFKPPLYLMD